MSIILAAVALASAPPAAHAEAPPASAPASASASASEGKCCCEKMDRKMECCEMHRKRTGVDDRPEAEAHEGHDGG